MAWYVDTSGRQVWVDADETVYTVTAADDNLPVHTLTYLAVNSKKTVYTEHAIQDEIEAKGKKKDQAGKQRGFIVRVETESDDCNVISCFHAAARKLLDDRVVSRIDHDEGQTERRRKKRGQKKVEEPQEDQDVDVVETKQIDLSTLAPNECRVETIARCTHNAHGPGFRVEVAKDGSRQALHMFTDKKELPVSEWFDRISDAIRSTGPRVMDCRVAPSLCPTGADGKTLEGGVKGARRKEEAEAQNEDDEWLSSMMGMAPASGKEQKTSEAEKPQGELPPWLRPRRTRRAKQEDEA